MRNTEIRETPIEENMKTLLPQKFIDQGYEVRAYLSVDGSKSLNTICYTPYGTFADVWTPLKMPTIAGLCPVCNNTMAMPEAGFFTCKNGHPIVKMTTVGYTERKLYGRRKQTVVRRRPVVVQRRPDTTAYRRGIETENAEPPVSVSSVKDQVAEALGDLL